jgi:hypothetical protein
MLKNQKNFKEIIKINKIVDFILYNLAPKYKLAKDF